MGRVTNYYDDLVKRIAKPLLFYIPKRLFPNTPELDKVEGELGKVFDIPILLDSNNEVSTPPNVSSLFHLLAIPQSLNLNLVTLADSKDELKVETFNFLYSQYWSLINFYFSLLSELSQHAKQDLQTTEEYVLEYFQLQSSFYKNHLHEIENLYGLQASGKDIHPAKFHLEKIGLKNYSFQCDSVKSITIVKGNKKQPLITDNEARKFLIESIFIKPS